MELTPEQRRVVEQLGNHVSVALANRVREYFVYGGLPDDLRHIIADATEVLKEKAKAAR